MSIQAALCGNSAQPVNAYVNPTFAFGARSGAGTVTTSGATAYPSGGTPGFTYAWTFVSGDAVFTANTATASNTTWHCTVGIGDYFTATWQCVVTDSVGTASAPQLLTVAASEISFQ